MDDGEKSIQLEMWTTANSEERKTLKGGKSKMERSEH